MTNETLELAVLPLGPLDQDIILNEVIHLKTSYRDEQEDTGHQADHGAVPGPVMLVTMG